MQSYSDSFSQSDYLKNEKSFQNEIKKKFPCFTSSLTQTYKTNYQNVTQTLNKWQDGI